MVMMVALCWLTKSNIQCQANEHQDHTHPLPWQQSVIEDYDWAQKCEEFPGGGEDGAGQGSKVGDGCENKYL